MDEIYILDAVNYIFRSYYAISSMTNDSGKSTNALYGFIRSVNKLRTDFSPTHLVAVFDGPDNTKEREAIYSEYKKHRKKAPDDLYYQIDWAFEYCKMAGIPALCVPGVEADDAMASIAVWASNKARAKAFICTSDKDLFQLVKDDIFVLNIHKNNLLVDKDKVEEIFGVRPDQILDLLAIMGDNADNIPGLPGFGPKTAASLLQKFGDLNTILDNPEKVPGKKKQETIVQEREKALMSKELARLRIDTTIPEDSSFYLLTDPDIEKLEPLFREMKFMTLLSALGKKEEAKVEEKTHYLTIETESDLHELVTLFSKEKELCIDTETTSTNPYLAELVGIGLSAKPLKAAYIPLNGKLAPKTVLDILKPLLENPAIGFLGHHIKYDYHVLLNHGIDLKNISFDTMLASYLIQPQNRRHNLDSLVLDHFQKTKIPIKSLLGDGKKKKTMKEVEIEKVSEYCCEDVDYTYRLKELYEKEIKELDIENILYEIEIPLLPVLAKMETNGIFLDSAKLETMRQVLEVKIESIQSEIYDSVGETFNLNSPKQLSEILFVRLGLKKPSRAKSEYATGAKVLEMLAEEHVVASKVLEYRGLEKLRSTYVSALPLQINPKTNRIHCTFNQSVAATGRLSCQDPNLQNIPIRSEEGRKIREGFRPEKEGWVYLAADYSQIELRLLAHLSEDEKLIQAFNNGQDIHAYTASLVYDLPLEMVTSEMRYAAKAVNFGILYGQSAFGLAQELNIPRKRAAEFIKTYFERYPRVSDYLDLCKQTVKEKGVSFTLTGRRRPIPEIENKNPMIRGAAERLAVNTPLQGTAADIIKMAMINIDKEMSSLNLEGFMILQVHDELIFEIPIEEVPTFRRMVKEKMENVVPLKVPLTVDIEVGKNWSEC